MYGTAGGGGDTLLPLAYGSNNGGGPTADGEYGVVGTGVVAGGEGLYGVVG